MSTTNGLIWYLRQTRGAVIGYSCQSVSLPNSRLRFTLSPFNHQWVNMIVTRTSGIWLIIHVYIYMYVCMYDIYIFVFLHCVSCRIGLIWRIKRGKSEAVVIEWQNKMTKIETTCHECTVHVRVCVWASVCVFVCHGVTAVWSFYRSFPLRYFKQWAIRPWISNYKGGMLRMQSLDYVI